MYTAFVVCFFVNWSEKNIVALDERIGGSVHSMLRPQYQPCMLHEFPQGVEIIPHLTIASHTGSLDLLRPKLDLWKCFRCIVSWVCMDVADEFIGQMKNG